MERASGSWDLGPDRVVALVRVLGRPIAGIFVGYDAGLLALTTHAFYIFSLSFLLGGFSTFASALFTALGNGKISALISFLKTFFFETASILLLPAFLELTESGGRSLSQRSCTGSCSVVSSPGERKVSVLLN